MKPRKWIVLPLLLVTSIAMADDKPAPKAAPPAKPTFDLNDAALKKILRETAANSAAPAPADSSTEPASAVAAQIGTLPMRKGKTPITVNCDGIAVDCAALDANGNELYRVPRWQVFGINSGDPTMASPCQSSNNLLSTFERSDRCRGIGLLLPTPWDKVNVALPAISQK